MKKTEGRKSRDTLPLRDIIVQIKGQGIKTILYTTDSMKNCNTFSLFFSHVYFQNVSSHETFSLLWLNLTLP